MLLALATAKVATIDLQYYNAAWHTLLFNPTFASFALLIGALAICVWFYLHDEDAGDKERAGVPILLAAANVLAVTALSAEALGYYDRAKALIGRQPWEEVSRLSGPSGVRGGNARDPLFSMPASTSVQLLSATGAGMVAQHG